MQWILYNFLKLFFIYYIYCYFCNNSVKIYSASKYLQSWTKYLEESKEIRE